MKQKQKFVEYGPETANYALLNEQARAKSAGQGTRKSRAVKSPRSQGNAKPLK